MSISLKIRSSEDMTLRQGLSWEPFLGRFLGLEDRISTDSGFHWWLFTFYPWKCKKLWYKTLPGQTAVTSHAVCPSRGLEPWAADYRIKASSITQRAGGVEKQTESRGEVLHTTVPAGRSNSVKERLGGAPSRIQTPVIILGFASWAPITTTTSGAKAEPWEATLTWHWSALFCIVFLRERQV